MIITLLLINFALILIWILVSKNANNVTKFELTNGVDRIDIAPHYAYDDWSGYYLVGYKVLYVRSGRIRRIKIKNDSNIIERYKDTKREAIIKIGDVWYKLDKPKQTIIDIPEPLEFAEKEEVTE